MDKIKVIEAYRRGLITLQECGQILGAEKTQIHDLVNVESMRHHVSQNTLIVVDNV